MSHQKQQHKGRGIVNTLINKLPFELHIPTYQYCGPGTKLAERLARGDKPKNALDQACMVHDIAYSKSKDLKERHLADKQLAEAAWKRAKASDSTIGEKASALFVTGAMKAKTSLGMGLKKKKTKKTKKTINFTASVRKARNALKKSQPTDLKAAVKIAKAAVRGQRIKAPTRVIPVPKSGGVLPLIPIFAGLSALGALAGGASGIAKAVTNYKSARDQLNESQRHNKTMEAIAMGKGLYLRPYNKGMGLYLAKN